VLKVFLRQSAVEADGFDETGLGPTFDDTEYIIVAPPAKTPEVDLVAELASFQRSSLKRVVRPDTKTAPCAVSALLASIRAVAKPAPVSPSANWLASEVASFDRASLKLLASIRAVAKTAPVPTSTKMLASEVASFDRSSLKQVARRGLISPPPADSTRSALLSSIRSMGGAVAPTAPSTAPPPLLLVDKLSPMQQFDAELRWFHRDQLRSVQPPPVVHIASQRVRLMSAIRGTVRARVERQSAEEMARGSTAARVRLMTAIQSFRSCSPTATLTVPSAAGSRFELLGSIRQGKQLRPSPPRPRAHSVRRCTTVLAEIREFPRRKRALCKVVPKVLHSAQVRSKLVKLRECRVPIAAAAPDVDRLHAQCMSELANSKVPFSEAQCPSRAVLGLVKDFPKLRHCLRSVNNV
jgi:hypothetical protein